MDVNINSDPAEDQVPATATARAAGEKRKLSWREYLETDDAVRMIYLVFGFAAILLVIVLLQFQTKAICCGDWDGYYHIRWSSLLWDSFKTGHWLPSFDWLPLTVLNPNDYNDHHFLFHLLQIPFLWFFEPVMAAKVAATTYATLAIFSVYWMLYRYKVDYLLVWLAALLVCSNAFYYRMNMAKAPPIAIIMTVIGIHLLFQRKYVWLLPLMFAFVWTYSLFPLLMIAAILWALVIGWNERRFEWKPLAYTFSGMVLGNVINPYFPHNITLFIEHFATKFEVVKDFAVAVGGEWYPYSGMELLTNFPIAMGAMLLGYILFMPRNNGKVPAKATFLLGFASILLAAQFRSKRFAEYFPPFALLFGAFSWKAFFAPKVRELPEDFTRDIESYLDADKGGPSPDRTWKVVKLTAAWVIGITLVGWLALNLKGVNLGSGTYGGLLAEIRNNEDADKYKRAMEWATGQTNGVDNMPAGERIFNANWDDFPKLFFYNQKHSYVYGLDPNYLYSKNPELYKLLLDITNAKGGDAGPLIRERFGARYIFADAKENEDMIAKALESGWTEIIYEDDEARILKIRDVKGDPPGDAVDDAPANEEELKKLEEMERADNANKPANDEDEEPEEK